MPLATKSSFAITFDRRSKVVVTSSMLGRPGPEFRPSEVARLGYLAGIVATMLR